MTQNPYDILRRHHIEKYGWMGSCIKAHRISRGMSRHSLARELHIRESTLTQYEDEFKKVGIKLAKDLAEIFKTDWHVFRRQPKDLKILTTEEYNEYEKSIKNQPIETTDKVGKVKRGRKKKDCNP